MGFIPLNDGPLQENQPPQKGFIPLQQEKEIGFTPLAKADTDQKPSALVSPETVISTSPLFGRPAKYIAETTRDIVKAGITGTQTIANIATGMIAWPISKTAGIIKTIAGGGDEQAEKEGREFEERVAQKWTVAPNDPRAKEAVEVIGNILNFVLTPIVETAKEAGKITKETLQDHPLLPEKMQKLAPLLSYVTEFGTELALFKGAHKVAGKIKKVLTPKEKAKILVDKIEKGESVLDAKETIQEKQLKKPFDLEKEIAVKELKPAEPLQAKKPKEVAGFPIKETQKPLKERVALLKKAGFKEAAQNLKKAEIKTKTIGFTPLKKKTAFNPEKHSLADFVRQEGGISTAKELQFKGEARQFSIKEGFNLVNNKTGKTFDELHTSAVEEGFIDRNSTASDFIDLLANDVKSNKLSGRAWSVRKQSFEEDIQFYPLDEKGSIDITAIKKIPEKMRETFEVPEPTSKEYKTINREVENWRIKRNYGAKKAQILYERARKVVPDESQRKMIPDAIENPNLKASLTPEQKSVLNGIQRLYKDYETILKKEGILDTFLENYVNHIILETPKKGRLSRTGEGGKLGAKPSFTRQRVRTEEGKTYTIKELEAKGYKVEKDIAKLGAYYQVVAEQAISNKRIVDTLKKTTTKEGKKILRPFRDIPLEEKGDYYVIDEMQLKRWSGTKTEKGIKLFQIPTGLHKNAWSLIDNILGERRPPSQLYLKFAKIRSDVKRLIMFNPLIHGFNVESNVIMALGKDYPRRFYMFKDKTPQQIEAMKFDMIRDGVELEGLFDVKGRLAKDIYQLKIPEQTELKQMITNPIKTLRDVGDKILWDKWVGSGQMAVYGVLKERGLKKGLPEAKAGHAAAMMTNDLLGTLPSTWFTKNQRRFLFNTMFARNWTVSNLRTLTGMMGKKAKSKYLPKPLRFENVTDAELKVMSGEYRKVVVKGVIGALTTANIVQSMFLKMNGQKFHPTWQNEEDHRFDIDTGMIDPKKGKIYLKNWLFRQIDDYIKLFEGHPIQFAKAKAEPIMRTIAEIILNVDYFGKPIIKRGMTRTRALLEISKYIVKGITPLDNFIGRENEVRTWAEALLPLTGTWIRHGMPTGKQDPRFANILKGYYEYKAKKSILKNDIKNKVSKLIQQGKDQEALKLIDQVNLTKEQFINILKSLKIPFWSRVGGKTKFKSDFIEYLFTLPENKKQDFIDAIEEEKLDKALGFETKTKPVRE